MCMDASSCCLSLPHHTTGNLDARLALWTKCQPGLSKVPGSIVQQNIYSPSRNPGYCKPLAVSLSPIRTLLICVMYPVAAATSVISMLHFRLTLCYSTPTATPSRAFKVQKLILLCMLMPCLMCPDLMSSFRLVCMCQWCMSRCHLQAQKEGKESLT